ncbi:MAG: hypothetical protein AAF509_07190 [Pseudomonadota bacterium]
MNLSYESFLGLAFFWMCLCFLCGVKRRPTLLLALLFLGLSMTSMWLSATLKVAPFEERALILHGSGLICAVTSYLMGRFFARIGDAWRDSRVEEGDA